VFSPVDSKFEFDGSTYLVRKQPKLQWPCQNCDMMEICTAENISRQEWPSCRSKDRKDRRDVVFSLVSDKEA